MPVSVERMMQMSAITPLVELRRYLSKNEGVTPADAVAALLVIDESFVASDHEAALELHGLLDPVLMFGDLASDLRVALSEVVTKMRPTWAKRVSLGRGRFLSQLDNIDKEVRRCFGIAGLLDDEPTNDVIHWWDCLHQGIRGLQALDNVIQGRLAEQKSLEYERKRLKELGIEHQPKWQAIDDNTLGYDILSFKSGGEFPTQLMIEVKSSSHNPPTMVISREEWRKAKQVGENYLFHFWDVKADRLYECGVGVIDAHIPENRGLGEWKDVYIPVGAVK